VLAGAPKPPVDPKPVLAVLFVAPNGLDVAVLAAPNAGFAAPPKRPPPVVLLEPNPVEVLFAVEPNPPKVEPAPEVAVPPPNRLPPVVAVVLPKPPGFAPKALVVLLLPKPPIDDDVSSVSVAHSMRSRESRYKETGDRFGLFMFTFGFFDIQSCPKLRPARLTQARHNTQKLNVKPWPGIFWVA
jgi:hypothetical protein